MGRENTVAIVGGGVSGALTAYHLVRSATLPLRVVVIDPRPELGLGLAYSTPSLRHLLNVPVGKISALPCEPDHFLHWLQAHYDPQMTRADFAPRAIFGRYIQSLLATTRGIEHLQTSVLDCQVAEKQATLTLANGATLTADMVVLATGNFEPAALPHCEPAWENATYENLPIDAPVTLIGTGLTAVDVLLRLRERGHRGTVTAISRHGVFPKRHGDYEPLAECVITGTPPEKTRQLLQAVHQALKAGKDWRAVIDSIRPRTNELWSALPLVEKKRFRRHLQRRWEIVRHRMAPSIADFLDAELAGGTLVIRRGGLSAVERSEDGFTVQYRSGGRITEVAAARVTNCTGPDLNYHRVGSPLLNSLFAQGQIVDGPLGTGLWSDQRGALRKEDGTASTILFNIGPGRVGVLFESIAVQELRVQAMDLADFLAAQVSKPSVKARIPVLAF